jgi:hypothetical protein
MIPETAPDHRRSLTPLTDVVFLLLIFFLVTMRFESLDMKVEADLPKGRGVAEFPIDTPPPPKLVARLRPAAAAGGAARVELSRRVLGTTTDPATWERFERAARAARRRHAEAGGDLAEFEAEVDAVAGVRTGDVLRALDAFVAVEFQKIVFPGAPPPGRTGVRLPPR